MATEQIEDNSNLANEPEKAAESAKRPVRSSRRKESEVVALSLQNQAQSGGLKLATKGELLLSSICSVAIVLVSLQKMWAADLSDFFRVGAS